MISGRNSVVAAILAGGLGTRLRPVVTGPKVTAPVTGRPFLTHLLDQLGRAGFEEVVLLTGYGADSVREALGDRYGPVRLVYSRETTPLGTAGAVRYALPRLHGDTVLLLNGDSYCEVDVQRLQRFHETRAGGVSMVVARVEDAARFGRVQRGADGEVLRFEEKRPGATPGWINAGIYLLPRVLLTEIPPGRPTSLEREVLPAWVAEGLVQAFETCGRFIDIGTPESYAAAEGFFEVVEVAAA